MDSKFKPTTDAELISFYVPRTKFNRTNYPDLTGRFFPINNQPSYVQLRPHTVLESTEYLQTELTLLITQAVIKVEELVRRCKY
jgi:hypothetical protein